MSDHPEPSAAHPGVYEEFKDVEAHASAEDAEKAAKLARHAAERDGGDAGGGGGG
jgi:hypothetical protein